MGEPSTDRNGSPSTGWYAYGVVQAEDIQYLPSEGLESGRPPQAVVEGDLGAIVSEVDLAQFAEDQLEDNLRDATWLESRVRAHERVLEALINDRPVLPMRFGTIFRDEYGVRALLSRRRDDLRSALDDLAGTKEWGVRAFVEQEVLERWVRRRSTTPPPPQGGEGAAYLGARRDQRELELDIERASEDVRRRAEAALRPVARAVRRRGAVASPGHARAVDLAVLLPDDRLSELQRIVADLDRWSRRRGLRFEITGPWPPYTFVTMDLSEDIRAS
jgi:hypothetical protein